MSIVGVSFDFGGDVWARLPSGELCGPYGSIGEAVADCPELGPCPRCGDGSACGTQANDAVIASCPMQVHP
jgi:hypothetical protein